jgi:hypothetical protein
VYNFHFEFPKSRRLTFHILWLSADVERILK